MTRYAVVTHHYHMNGEITDTFSTYDAMINFYLLNEATKQHRYAAFIDGVRVHSPNLGSEQLVDHYAGFEPCSNCNWHHAEDNGVCVDCNVDYDDFAAEHYFLVHNNCDYALKAERWAPGALTCFVPVEDLIDKYFGSRLEWEEGHGKEPEPTHTCYWYLTTECLRCKEPTITTSYDNFPVCCQCAETDGIPW
jgi:hypothetical protein